MVYQVLMDKATNKARGVTYVDRITRETREVRAKTVVLCAQALESTRILFNSATRTGLGNSSGVLGHYLMDHMWVAGGATGEFPDMPGKPSLNAGRRPGGPYVIRFRNTANGERHKDFLRGYGFQGGSALNFNDGRAGLRPGLQGRRQERPVDDEPGRASASACPTSDNRVDARTRTSPTSSASPCCTSTWRGARTRRR